MKAANIGNLTIIITLIMSAILGQYYADCLSITFLLGLFIMPVYQLLVGSIWFFSSKRNKQINLYFIGVFTFFFIEFCNSLYHKTGNQRISEQILDITFPMIPIILATYFTYILNQYSRE